MTEHIDRAKRRIAREAAEAKANAKRAAELAKRTEMTTYRHADGSYIDDYAHVGELDWWDDADEPVMVIGERWVLAERWGVEVPQSAVELRDALSAEAGDTDD